MGRTTLCRIPQHLGSEQKKEKRKSKGFHPSIGRFCVFFMFLFALVFGFSLFDARPTSTSHIRTFAVRVPISSVRLPPSVLAALNKLMAP